MQNLFAHAERIENGKITTIIPAETETCKILKVKKNIYNNNSIIFKF